MVIHYGTMPQENSYKVYFVILPIPLNCELSAQLKYRENQKNNE